LVTGYNLPLQKAKASDVRRSRDTYEREAELLYNVLVQIPTDTTIVVEGPSDKEMLLRISVLKARVITLREFTAYAPNIDRLIILTDYDEEGERLNTWLINLINSEYPHIRIMRWYRERLKPLFSRYGEVYSCLKHLSRVGVLERYIRYTDIDWEYENM